MANYNWAANTKRTGNSEASEQETAEMARDAQTPIEQTPADGVGPTPEARANVNHVPDAPDAETEDEGGLMGFFKKLFG